MVAARVLVTGATGKTGGALVDELLAQGSPVRALVRRRDARSQRLERRGVHVVEGDMADPERMAVALSDVQRVYFLPPLAPNGLHAAAAFVAAAQVTRPEAVVQMSQWLAHPAHPSVTTRELWLTERMFATLPGVAHVVLDPGMFADNFARLVDYAALLRLFPLAMGASESAPVSNEDIARVAAALLSDPARHAGRRYRPTGPQLLSGRDMARIMAGVLGHRVLPLEVPFWLFNKVARLDGVDIHSVFSYRDYIADHKAGAFSFEGGVTDVVPALTGRPAEEFATIVRRYAAMPFARVSVGRRLSALARFMVAPVMPGHDLRRYRRERGFPEPSVARLASDDPGWRAAHGGRMTAGDAAPATLAAE